MENSMELVNILVPLEKLRRENGLMVKELLGETDQESITAFVNK